MAPGANQRPANLLARTGPLAVKWLSRREQALAPGNSQLLPRLDALLFGESQARIIISVAPLDAVKVLAQAKILGIPASYIGIVGGAALSIKTGLGNLECDVTELHDLWWNAIARSMRET